MKNLIDTIIENKGATLTTDLKDASLEEGYMVSLEGSEVVSPRITFKMLKDYAKAVTNGFVGVWFNEDDSNYYLDTSINVKDLNEALKLAKLHNQLAIYDIKNEAVITV